MSIELNHTIVHARDNRESAEFLAHILGLTPGTEWGPFIPVATSNGVTLDFATVPADPSPCSTTRSSSPTTSSTRPSSGSRARASTYFADPQMKQPGEINHNHGGRGVYFLDPGGSRHGDHHPPLRQRGADTARGVSAV